MSKKSAHRPHHHTQISLLALTIIALAISVLALLKLNGGVVKSVRAATSRSFYVDCQKGRDSNPGTSAKPWKTLTPVTYALNSSGSAQPGDVYYLKSGCTFSNAQILIEKSGTIDQPITLTSYPSGSTPATVQSIDPNITTVTLSPIILVKNANNVVIKNISLDRTVSKYNPANNYQINKIDRVGIQIQDGSSSVLVDNVTIRHQAVGIRLTCDWNFANYYTTYKNCSHDNKISNSRLVDNYFMIRNTPGGDDDSGAQSIDIIGSNNNTISNNTIQNSSAKSYDYGTDGAAIEIFGASGNIINNNTVKTSDAFIELGTPSDHLDLTHDNTIHHNIYCSSVGKSNFLVTRGVGNYGPVTNTIVDSNSAYTAGTSPSILCDPGCNESVLNLSNSIIWSVNKSATWIVGSYQNTNNTLINDNHAQSQVFTNPGSCDLTDTNPTQGAL